LDNLNECYLQAASLIEQVHVDNPDASVIADYTGGTKSMTAGLAAAALDDGQCEIRLVTGARPDLQIVADRTDFVRPIHVWDTQVARQLRVAIRFIARYDYASAAAFLEETSRRFASDEKLTRWISFCRAFDAWDRFDHQAAQALLDAYEGHFGGHKAFLSMLMGAKIHHGWELVEDLLLNSERRAVQARYDDATGRLYRPGVDRAF
jgi:CRISPR-associated protein (TIGR02710 family)